MRVGIGLARAPGFAGDVSRLHRREAGCRKPWEHCVRTCAVASPEYKGEKESRGFSEDTVWTSAIIANEVDKGAFSIFPQRKTPVHPEKLAAWNKESADARLNLLVSQLSVDILRAVASFESPIMTNAFIAGDMVILDMLAREQLLPHVSIVMIDTLHLFPETMEFMSKVEKHYGITILKFKPSGIDSKSDWNQKYGSDLYMTEPVRYDQLAKVEPLERALKELNVDCWINGRRRDHGNERQSLPVFEMGSPVKANVLAHWTFEDCWSYIYKNNVPYHPLHDQGFPSVGDVHSTLPVERRDWFRYGGERSGRFSGFSNSDGSPKTECGIHVQ